MYKVAVLMSTYNGEKYLREQIDSILAQKGVDLTLYIRDDGSSDGTIEVIKEYIAKTDKIKLNIGKNIGVGNSFMQLIYDCPEGYDYYAFSDQDDIWLVEKLHVAVEMLKEYYNPILYCSNQMLVDKNGDEIGLRHSKPVDISYLQILCNNMITGCTMVWNRKLQDFLTEKANRPSSNLLHKRIHDVWVAMVASVVGEIRYDERAYIQYRQHENNVVGVKKVSLVKEWKKKFQNKELRNGRSTLAKEITTIFSGQLMNNKEMKDRLLLCAKYQGNKMKLFRDTEIRFHSNEGTLMYGMKILLNLL